MTPARWTGFSALVLAGIGLVVGPAFAGTFTSDAAVAAAGFVVSAATGGLIIGRRDGHLTGWLLVSVGVAIVFANGFVLFPGVSDQFAVWVGSWAWTLVLALYAVLTLTFPSGRVPQGPSRSARIGRWAVWLLPVLVVAAPFTETLGGSEVSSATANPVGFLPSWLSWFVSLATFAIFLAAAIGVVVRRHRADGVTRAQLSWVVYALLLLVLAFAGTFAFILVSIAIGAGDPGDDAWTVVFLLMAFLPAAFAVAILRYRLFEIDRIVSRTVSYSLVIGALAALFAGIVIGLPPLLGLPDDSPLLVSGATLAVAALFDPLRRRVQGRVDRRFNRARYDAQQEVDRFTDHLRTGGGMDDLAGPMLDVVARTMQPASASVWLRESS